MNKEGIDRLSPWRIVPVPKNSSGTVETGCQFQLVIKSELFSSCSTNLELFDVPELFYHYRIDNCGALTWLGRFYAYQPSKVTISIHSIIRFDQNHPFNGTSISSNPVLNGEEEASIKRYGCGWVSTYKSLLEPPKDMPPLIQTAKWTLNNETLIVSRTNNWSNINGIWKFV